MVSPIERIVLWATFLCSEILYFLTITQQFSGLKKKCQFHEVLETGEPNTYTHEYQHAGGSKVLADRGYYDFFTMQNVRQKESI
jgi:hypothetical protein